MPGWPTRIPESALCWLAAEQIPAWARRLAGRAPFQPPPDADPGWVPFRLTPDHGLGQVRRPTLLQAVPG
jgi:hypothetical protein